MGKLMKNCIYKTGSRGIPDLTEEIMVNRDLSLINIMEADYTLILFHQRKLLI